ncbi:unnamed protein product [Leuciscus chuanchicus]
MSFLAGRRRLHRSLALARLPPRAANLKLRPDDRQHPARSRMFVEAGAASGRERVRRERPRGARAERPARPQRGLNSHPDRPGKRGGEHQAGPAPKRRALQHLVPQRSTSDMCNCVVNVVSCALCSIKQTTFSQTELFSPLAPHTVLPALPSSSAESRSIAIKAPRGREVSIPSPQIAVMTTVAMTAGLDRATLSHFQVAWEAIPGIWPLNVIWHGYTLQFKCRPPRFRGVIQSLTLPQNAHVLRQEVCNLLEKGAIESVSPSERESGFYSRYFVVPKKGGGLHPILDLRPVNRALHKRILAQIRPGDWFASVDLKDAYFHIQIVKRHRRFLRFAFENSVYQYTVLPFGLALAPRTFSKCVDAALSPLRSSGMRVLNYLDDWLVLAQSKEMLVSHVEALLRHLEMLGLRVNVQKSVLTPSQTTTFLGVHLDSVGMRARLSPERAGSSSLGLFRPGRLVPLKEFQRLLGRMAAASSVCHLGLLHMRLLQHWLKARVPPECVLEQRHVLIRTDNTSVVSYINRQGGVHSRALFKQVESLLLWADRFFLSVRAAHIPGVLNRGADMLLRSGIPQGEWRLHPGTVQLIWKRFGRAEVDLFATCENTHCRMFFSLSRSPREGDALTARWPKVCLYAFPPVKILPMMLCKIREEKAAVTLVAPNWPNQPWFADLVELLAGRPWEIPLRKDLLSQASGSIWQPPCVAVAGLLSGLDTLHLRALRTIAEAQALSTRRLYALKWVVFSKWCQDVGIDPGSCSVSDILRFLQYRMDEGSLPSTLKEYEAAIAAFHPSVDGQSIGRHASVTRFLRGARRLCPARPPSVPPWDLTLVLEALSRPPFEPLASIAIKELSIKTALLLALASAKRIGDLQAYSVVDMLPKDDLRTHVLLLDGHTSHVFNIKFLRLMQSHRVHVVGYSSHTTHCLQPVDKSLFKSLRHHWSEEGQASCG